MAACGPTWPHSQSCRPGNEAGTNPLDSISSSYLTTVDDMQLTIVTGNACLGNNGLSDLRGQVIASSWKCLEGLLCSYESDIFRVMYRWEQWLNGY